jgi:RNA polymerase sigma-70 factor (ECF subfamily)
MDYERFATLVAPHATAMARVATALVGRADAEDAAQEALMRAWHGWPAFREPSAVRPWLLHVTVNVCRNWQAGRFGTARRSTELLSASRAAPHLATALGELGTGDHADALDLRGAVAALHADLRQVVALRFYAGMDATEIGAVMDLPSATVRTRLRRALTLLRQELHVSQDAPTTILPGGNS